MTEYSEDGELGRKKSARQLLHQLLFFIIWEERKNNMTSQEQAEVFVDGRRLVAKMGELRASRLGRTQRPSPHTVTSGSKVSKLGQHPQSSDLHSASQPERDGSFPGSP